MTLDPLHEEAEFWSWYLTGEPEREPTDGRALRVACSERYALVVELSRFETTLLLESEGSRTLLGWEDAVRAHASALRWDEARAIVARAENPDLATLLLAPFIGIAHDDDAEIVELRAAVGSALRALRIEGAEMAEACAPKPPGEPDYAWTHDTELGWVYGGEYPCYSLRNREHAGGSEGLFPFATMREVRRELGLEE